jgi:hypothetical protein
VNCKDCKQTFDPDDSLMGDEGQCQNCWEAEASRGWWLEVVALNRNIEQPTQKQ